MEKHKKHFLLQVFASDIDADAIAIGRQANYPESISADVTEERLDRFFTKEVNSYRVKKQIRDCVVFAIQDLAKDPPFSRLDLISCRNVLIYMEHDLQKKIFPIFEYSLVDSEFLYLGTSKVLVNSSIHFYQSIQSGKFSREKVLHIIPLNTPDSPIVL